MLKSNIKIKNGNPLLYIDGRRTNAMAYTTYFEERSCYLDFIKAGYRIFFVNVSFTTAPINNQTGFTPFRIGAFEDPDRPDYSEFEDAVRNILNACPDAVIFPRIYVSMPKRWIDSHPDDVVFTPGSGAREVLFSPTFRQDGEALLLRLVRHIKNADYASRIGGWQICGGQTQEWFHHDLNGSLGPAATRPYADWVKEEFAIDDASLPTKENFVYRGEAFNDCENARRYSAFCNLGVAETLEHFAKVIKKETDYRQIVGTFYGYAYENSCVLFGTHALRRLLDSEYLDFFSSPNAYTMNRALGIDWADMIPVDSVKHHGKLCFIECDVRTYLTTGMQVARPNEYPDNIYMTKNGKSVWAGPPTVELSREALRKSFAHQVAKGSAIWWFDMWGGWYRDPVLMQEMACMRRICEERSMRSGNDLSPEVVFFADERGYSNLYNCSPQLKGIKETRLAMGNTGVPYDSCMVEDADAILRRYKAAVFVMPLPSEAGVHAMELCDRMGIPYLCATVEHYKLTVDEIRDFYRANGLHCYTEEKDVVYVGNGVVALHCATLGEKKIKLPCPCRVTPLLGMEGGTQVTDLIILPMKQYGTVLLEAVPVE